MQAVETLLRRVQHTCRASLSQTHPYSYYRPSICVAELYRDWFIVDGMNQGNLEGLENFEKVTQDTVEAPSWRADERQFAVDQGDGVYPNYQGYRDRDIKRGPKPGDTTCSWCIVNWFDRKLESWKEGEVLDPINGTVVSLPQYLTRIKEAGQRCQTEDWNRIYHKNIWAYKEKGWLPEDWKDGDSDADRSTRGKHVQAGQVEDLFLEASPEQALRMQKVIEQKVAEIQRLASEKGEDAELLRLKQEMEGWSY